MFKAASIFAMLGSAAAFVPNKVQNVKSVQTVQMGLQDMVGVGVETGNIAWDPLGFSKLSQQSMNNPSIEWLRESELKHGRICMIAFVGVCATMAGIHLPGYPVQTNDWTAALPELLEKNPAAFVQIFTLIGVIEGVTYPGDLYFGKGRKPGVLLGKEPTDKTMQLKELKNGRAAMIAMAAFASHELLPGSVPLYDAMGM